MLNYQGTLLLTVFLLSLRNISCFSSLNFQQLFFLGTSVQFNHGCVFFEVVGIN